MCGRLLIKFIMFQKANNFPIWKVNFYSSKSIFGKRYWIKVIRVGTELWVIEKFEIGVRSQVIEDLTRSH